MKKLFKTIRCKDTILSHKTPELQITRAYKDILEKYPYSSSLFILFCICSGYWSEQKHPVLTPCLQEKHSNTKQKSETAAGSE